MQKRNSTDKSSPPPVGPSRYPTWFGLLQQMPLVIKCLDVEATTLRDLTGIALPRLKRLCAKDAKVWELDLTIAEVHQLIMTLRTLYAHQYSAEETELERLDIQVSLASVVAGKKPPEFNTRPGIVDLSDFFAKWGFPVEKTWLGFDPWLPDIDQMEQWERLPAYARARTLPRSSKVTEVPAMVIETKKAAKKTRPRSSTPAKALTLDIRLDGIEPAIWRRFVVTDDMSLGDLHRAIQAVMGWSDAHLHAFEIKGKRFGMPDIDHAADDLLDEEKVDLADVIGRKGSVFRYIYDYGDNWVHSIKVVEVEKVDSASPYPICLDGARACPPEDCGGVWFYDQILRVLSDPKCEEYEELKAMLDEGYNPEAFDIKTANESMKQARASTTR